MKRDNKAIKKRIDKLGLIQKHVAGMVKMTPETLNRIIKGDLKYVTPEKVATIHNYLDCVKTIFIKGKDFK